jgi:uncharacterized protein (DUF362 family)
VIKPNLNDLSGPNSGLTTDVQVVRALIQYLNPEWHPKEILIVESDSWNRLTEEAFDRLGYREIEASFQNVKLVNLSKAPSIRVDLPFPSYESNLRIPKLFMESDFFISVAKLRTHHTIISGVLKNQFGCIPRRFKGKYHAYLNDIISNLNLLLRPDWSLVDGLIAREQNGPRKIGLLLASCDPVALDSVSARIVGFNPERIPHIRMGARRSVGQMTNIPVLLDGIPLADLESIITPKFVGPSLPARFFNSARFALIRTLDRGRRLDLTLQEFAGLSAGLSAYSKVEVLRMLLDWKRISGAYQSVHTQARAMQD